MTTNKQFLTAKSKWLSILGYALVFAAAPAVTAATISGVSSTFLTNQASGLSWSTSMYNSNAFIRDENGVLVANLTGTVVDYEFIDGNYKGAAAVVDEITFSASGSRNSFNLWTEDLDPGVDSAIATGGENGSPNGGSIDISTLSGGTLWLIAGYWSGDITVNATMTDTDGLLSDVTMDAFTQVVRSGGSARGEHFAIEINFADAGDYESITWTDTSGYFTGVIVTAVPEPTVALLGSLGLMLLMRRRR